LAGGNVVTAHVANTGSMMGLVDPGLTVALLANTNPSRKLAYTLEMVQFGKDWVGVNTSRPNRIVEEAIQKRRIPALKIYDSHRREVKYGTNSRIDLLLEKVGLPACYVEVKNVTLKDGELGLFPDAVTTRGMKHLVELQEMVKAGFRSVMLFLVNRSDCEAFGVADGIDPEYGSCLRRVQKAGVELLAYRTDLDLKGIRLGKKLPIRLSYKSKISR
jgi:sugar fermentation stimulation protein A